MEHLVIGLGQIGSALTIVLSQNYEFTVHGFDLDTERPHKRYDMIHVCIPYNLEFVQAVGSYQEEFLKPNGITVVHSTVALGTCRKLSAVHSPVRGIHPNLVSGIQTFVKYFGGERATEAANTFWTLGIKTRITENSDTTEALKLWDTTIYAWNVILEKEIHKWCQEHNVDFEVAYRDSAQTYNEGYEALDRSEYKKFVLKHMDGPIGGHCLVPNCKLLESWVSDFILAKNSELEST